MARRKRAPAGKKSAARKRVVTRTRVAAKRKAPTRHKAPPLAAKRTGSGASRWSARVMQTSDAMDLESGVFKKRSARQVALSLKRSAEASRRRKSSPFRSAMSMLNFEINRGGKNLTAERRRVLNQAKTELRTAFGRPDSR